MNLHRISMYEFIIEVYSRIGTSPERLELKTGTVGTNPRTHWKKWPRLSNTIQTKLFPWLEQELDPLSDREREFVEVVCLLDLPDHMKQFLWRGFGRKKKSRISMAKAFIAIGTAESKTTAFTGGQFYLRIGGQKEGFALFISNGKYI